MNPALRKPQTVSDLTKDLKVLIQSEFADVYLIAEISNFKRHFPSGHCYFTLKDENATIASVMWSTRFNSLDFKPADGIKVLIWGRITVYEPRGSYQIDVNKMVQFGQGELQIAFENLKKKLSSEGLFDESRKRNLPKYPETVAIITSKTGAVIEDFKRVAAKRFPLAKIILFPSLVQGSNALQSVLKALSIANQPEYCAEIIVLARGGGSIEDLWTFNEEELAREIVKSRLPVVSAIGHDIDYTISDFVSDVRAATPSNAAEIIFPDKRELLERIKKIDYYIKDAVENRLADYKVSLLKIEKSYIFNKPLDLLNRYKMQLDENYKTLENVIKNKVRYLNERMDTYKKLLFNISPGQTLKRGFSYVTKGDGLISRNKSLKQGDEIKIIFYDGESDAKIK